MHGRLVLALTAASVALALLAVAAPRAAAQSTESASDPASRSEVDVLILLGPATEWGGRVRGQLSDLPVHTRTGAIPIGEERAARASAFARQQPAEVTVWLATDGDPAALDERGGAYVAIWLAGSGDLYTRRIAADWRALSAPDRSAALEMAALSVRSAVRSLLLDASSDPAPAPELAAPTPASDSALVHVAPESVLGEGTDATLSVASLLPHRVELEAGGAWQLYGRSTLGVAWLRAGVRLAWEDWAFELIGQYGLPAEANVGPARLELTRHALLAEAQYFAWEGGAWRLSPLLRAGATSLGRSSETSDDLALRPSTAKRHEFPTVGLGAIAELSLSTRLSMSTRSVLNLETAVPTFAVQTIDGVSAWSSTPWALQPSIELGANWLF
jgi:hypothetical protein